jgi:hypothetical protein
MKKSWIKQGKNEEGTFDFVLLYGKLKTIQSAKTAKLIHQWIPTYEFLHKQN